MGENIISCLAFHTVYLYYAQIVIIYVLFSTQNRENIPFTKFKAKEPVSRQPYRHTSSYEQDEEDGDDGGAIFKVVPPLDDPGLPVSTRSYPPAATTQPPAATIQPTATTTVQSASTIGRTNPPQPSLTAATTNVNFRPPPITADLQSKTPVAARLARFQALTQATQVMA